jgi:hypothetical protein
MVVGVVLAALTPHIAQAVLCDEIGFREFGSKIGPTEMGHQAWKSASCVPKVTATSCQPAKVVL